MNVNVNASLVDFFSLSWLLKLIFSIYFKLYLIIQELKASFEFARSTVWKCFHRVMFG